MYKHLLLLIFLVVLAFTGYGQKTPGKGAPGPCNNYEGYIPYQPEYMPIKRIRLVLHFFQKEDGSGNLQDIPAHREFIDRIINHLNGMYKNSDEMKPPGNVKGIAVNDKRIRFVVDTILFHRDSMAWNFRGATISYGLGKKDSAFNVGASQQRAEWMYKKFVKDNPDLPAREKDSAVNVFFVDIDGYDDRGMAAGIATKKWVYYAGVYDYYVKDPAHPNHWGPGMTLAHELGHAMGLEHPYDYHECADLPRTAKGATNNLMDSWPNEGNAITPCQLGTMHYNLSGLHGDIGDAVIRDWCEYHPDSAMHITGDTVTFTGARYLWGDLYVGRGTALIIKCTFSMPPGSHIYIKKGGSLIVDGGTVTNICGQQWGGIKMQKAKHNKKKPVLQIINGGQVTQNAGPMPE